MSGYLFLMWLCWKPLLTNHNLFQICWDSYNVSIKSVVRSARLRSLRRSLPWISRSPERSRRGNRKGSRMGLEPALNVVEGTSLLRASDLMLIFYPPSELHHSIFLVRYQRFASGEFDILLFSAIRPGVYPRCSLLCFSAGGLSSWCLPTRTTPLTFCRDSSFRVILGFYVS